MSTPLSLFRSLGHGHAPSGVSLHATVGGLDVRRCSFDADSKGFEDTRAPSAMAASESVIMMRENMVGVWVGRRVGCRGGCEG